MSKLKMSTLTKIFAILALIVTAVAATTAPADARHWRRQGYYGGSGSGWGFGFGIGVPYRYYGPRYYAPPVYYAPRVYYGQRCGWERVRVWRNGHWRYRSVRRCW